MPNVGKKKGLPPNCVNWGLKYKASGLSITSGCSQYSEQHRVFVWLSKDHATAFQQYDVVCFFIGR